MQASSSTPCLTDAHELASVLRTALGPCGRDKLVVSSTGQITVTADGATLMREMGVEAQPVGRMVLSLAETQRAAYGDGTTSAVVLLGSLCDAAQRLIEQGAHPWAVIGGYQAAVDIACDHIETLAVQPSMLPSKNSTAEAPEPPPAAASRPAHEESRKNGQLTEQETDDAAALCAIGIALGEHVAAAARPQWSMVCLESARWITTAPGGAGSRAGSFQPQRAQMLPLPPGTSSGTSGILPAPGRVGLLRGVALRKRFAQNSHVLSLIHI